MFVFVPHNVFVARKLCSQCRTYFLALIAYLFPRIIHATLNFNYPATVSSNKICVIKYYIVHTLAHIFIEISFLFTASSDLFLYLLYLMFDKERHFVIEHNLLINSLPRTFREKFKIWKIRRIDIICKSIKLF